MRSFLEFGSGGRGRGEIRGGYDLVFSTSHGKYTAVCFHVYPDLAKKAGLMAKDEVDIQYDPVTGWCLIKRITKGSGGIGVSGSKGGRTLCIRKVWRDGMPSIPKATAMERVTVTKDGIQAVFPTSVSFNGLVAPSYTPRSKK